MKKALLCAGLLGALSPLAALADSSQPISQVGIEGYHEKYEETVNGSRFMEEKGRMLGLTGAVRFDLSEVDAFSLQGRLAWGSSDYSSASGKYNGLSRQSSDVRFVYQRDVLIGQQKLVPEVGLGYRRLVDNLQESGPGGYERESTYQYFTVGLRSVHPLAEGWRVEPKINYNYLIRGEQNSKIQGMLLSDGNGNFGVAQDDLKNKQSTGHGFELSATFVKDLADQTALSITPFWRAWRIAKSDERSVQAGNLVLTGFEPQNKTDEIGVNVSYHF